MLLHFPLSVDSRIRQAIAGKNLVEIHYKHQTRIVEPHDYGVQNGVDRVFVYQLRVTAGRTGKDAVGWRLLDVPKIESLVVLESTFKGSRGQSGQAHHAWDKLYARVG